MARRRSANRRSSRRSMNITELDDDSELIDRGNPMWWKIIEGDMSLRPLRRSSYAETTSDILDPNSRVNLSDLGDEWWNKLDKTNHESPQISARQSLKPTETSYESFISDDTDDVSIKKRKVLFGPKANKSGARENFARVLVDSHALVLSEPLPGEKRKSKSDVKTDSEIARKKVRKNRDQGNVNSPEVNDEDTSVNSSNDTDVIMKTRLKPFKRRFTTLSDGLFDDILKNDTAGPSAIHSVPQTSENDDSPAKNSSSRRRTSFSNKSLAGPDRKTKTPIQFSDFGESELMGPPKMSLHRKRLSSISRKLNLTSDESENDGGLKKTRSGFVRKNRDNLSINPFDKILNGHLEDGRGIEDPGEKNLSFGARAGNESQIDLELGNFRGSQERINRRSISVIKENPGNSRRHSDLQERSNSTRKSFLAGNSQDQIIEEIIENEEKISPDKLSKSLGRPSVETKILQVALTRISPRILERQMTNPEEPNNEEEVENVRIRSLRSASKNRIADSAYELPDKDRSTTPMITASESENEKSPAKNLTRTSSRLSLRRHHEVNKNKRESIERSMRNEIRASESENEKSLTRNLTRTSSRLSLQRHHEVSKNKRESIERSMRNETRASESENEKSPAKNLSRTSSRLSLQRHHEVSKNKRESIERSMRIETRASTSRKINARENHWRTKIFSDEDMSVEDLDELGERNLILGQSLTEDEKAGGSRKSFVGANKSIKKGRIDENISEKVDAEEIEEKSSNSRIEKKTRTSGRNLTSPNKSQKSIRTDENISEEEDAERMEEKSSNSRIEKKTRTSGGNLTSPNKSQESIQTDENISEEEDAERMEEKSSNSRIEKKTRTSGGNLTSPNKSQESIQTDENISEEEDAERMEGKSSNSQLAKKSRTSKNSFAGTNKSQRSFLSDESENDADSAEETNSKLLNSQLAMKSRISKNSFAGANKSQKSFLSDESEDDGESAEETNSKSLNSQLAKKSRTSKNSFASAKKSQNSFLSADNISEDEAEIFRLGKKSRPTRESAAFISESRKTIVSDESTSENEEKRKSKSSNSQLEEKSGTSSEVIAPKNKHRQIIGSDESISEDEVENVEKTDSKSSNSQAEKKIRTSTKSLAPTNKSRQSTESGESLSENESEDAGKSNSKSSMSQHEKNTSTSRKSVASANESRQRIEFHESISKGEARDAEKSDSKGSNSRFGNNTRTSTKSDAPTNKSRQRVDSDESISEDEAEDAEKSDSKESNSRLENTTGTLRKSLASANKSRQIQPEEKMNEGEAKSAKQSFSISIQKGESSKNDANSVRVNVAQQVLESNETFEDAEEGGNKNLANERKTKQISRLSRNSAGIPNSTNQNESSLPARKSDENNHSPTIPLENVSVAPKPKNLTKKRVTSRGNKSNVSESQRNITDFFTSKFLQKSDNLTIRENATSFDKEKLILIKKKMESLKMKEVENMGATVKRKEVNVSKRPENFSKTKNSRTMANTPGKKTKVVDKAYIINGVVYKRPKLPRPKPWVTDRLYHHLWKFMEPKYKLATRVKSEKFVQQLCEVVALTIRRKKYENYKFEVDALMKEMARLGIVKTRNDFYHFCYDFLPYDFRVKVTPILLPGNVSTIPYDPAKLHAPILQTP